MSDNFELVTRGFALLTEILAPYVARELRARYGEMWWRDGVFETLTEVQRRDLPSGGDWVQLVDALDAARCLLLIDIHWNDIFRTKLSREHRNWVKELITTRNKWAHKGSGDFSAEDAWRALDTMARMAEGIDSETTEALRELVRQIRYGTTGASTTIISNGGGHLAPSKTTNAATVLTMPPRHGLQPWRFVVEPHPDVAQGRYRQAEFAADLAQVLRGTAQVEYQDPVEFFGRTYITEGMMGLLVQAVRRVSGLGGEPVIQLKTAFGGGKTHSMLALYHLLRGQAQLEKIPNARPLLEKAGVSKCPKARVAVLVGTALNPTKVRRPSNFPGITIRTLWGEMAAQLAEQASNPKIYDIVRDADKASVPPGSETLVELLDACGPCVILIDELVAYARKLYGESGVVAGTFDAVLTFVQELTEAARASKNSLLVASIPESDIEIGGEAGKKALEFIEHTFGRMEAIWKPVGAEEGFAIVRRRLFLPVQDEAARDEVCRAFSEMYREGGSDFPAECRELAYLERLKACYPIHPEVFDRLYDDWATLERFQKTRGVLRLMAAVIHDLWIRQDQSFLIMPGSIPLDNTTVREELTRYLPEGWTSVIESDVDGPRSQTYQIDMANQRFGRVMAARRVARSIFLGSAPSVKEQRVRGIEDIRARLGVVQPGEQVAIFNDAMGRLVNELTHLYINNQRYWYDLPPNLRRTVEDRAQQVSKDDVEMELERRLKGMRERGDFTAVHTCPSSSLEVPDEQAVRMVVLGPAQGHKAGDMGSPAVKAAEDILKNRGTGPRLYQNMLVFVAPDRELVKSLESESRRFLAWKSVVEDADALNLDAHQRRQAVESYKRSDETVDLRLKEAYCWLLVPTQDGINPVSWEITRISGGGDSPVVKASKSLRTSGLLITKWAPGLLRMELDKWLWKEQEYISIKQVWDYLCRYCYLSRLKDVDVLLAAINEGLASREFFGIAAGVTDTGRFMALRFGDSYTRADLSHFLVKAEPAAKQIQEEQEEEERRLRGRITYQPGSTHGHAAGEGTVHPGWDVSGGGDEGRTPQPEPVVDKKPRRFYATVQLDPTRISRDVGNFAQEILQHITSIVGAEVVVTLDVQAKIPDGVPDHVVHVVTENCRTLKVKAHGFEDS
ncbi:MAG: Swt1 family HEPN domain-containing protein [Bacillota bacterium]